MERKTIRIANISEEYRAGFSFNNLFQLISETEIADSVFWDFRNVSFLHPFFLAPLAIYRKTSSKNIECINIPLRLQYYLNSICFDRMLHFDNDTREDVEAVMGKYRPVRLKTMLEM